MSDSVNHSGAAGEYDLEAEILIDGTPVSPLYYKGAQTGSAIALVTPSAGHRLKVYKVFLTMDADVTGDFLLSFDATTIGGVQDPKEGGQYILLSAHPNFVIGGIDEVLKIKGPSDTAMVTGVYEVIPA